MTLRRRSVLVAAGVASFGSLRQCGQSIQVGIPCLVAGTRERAVVVQERRSIRVRSTVLVDCLQLFAREAEALVRGRSFVVHPLHRADRLVGAIERQIAAVLQGSQAVRQIEPDIGAAHAS